MNSAYLLNTAWMWQCALQARAFERATHDVRRAQQRLLGQILKSNARSAYGRQCGFDALRSVRDFQQQVPLSDYQSLRPHIEQIGAGTENVLTCQPVRLLEPTGGSSGGEKLIPYTAALRHQFQRALAAWIWDTMWHVPALRGGRAFWSISPAAAEVRQTRAGMRIGFDDDRNYLSRGQQWAVSRLLIVPRGVVRLRSLENFRYATLLYLLSAADLALISIWSPTYLTTLINELPELIDAICADLRSGRVRPPRPVDRVNPPQLPLSVDHRRADQLQDIFRGSGNMADKLSACWPQLALISCWADAHAAMYIPSLKSIFPRVPLQPKGLLATEGVVSFPLHSQPGGVLAIRSHFFEFLEVGGADASGSCATHPCLATELQVGRYYRVIMTTGGGLYRYQLGDVIKVVGKHHQCAVVSFVGRAGVVSDLVGEKLHEQHVRRVISAVCGHAEIHPRFALLAPVRTAPPHYRLFLECAGHGLGDESLRDMAHRLEEQLRTNPQYRLAVEFGQLQPADVRLLPSHAGGALRIYERRCLDRGQRAGDIKPVALDGWFGWSQQFLPRSSPPGEDRAQAFQS